VYSSLLRTSILSNAMALFTKSRRWEEWYAGHLVRFSSLNRCLSLWIEIFLSLEQVHKRAFFFYLSRFMLLDSSEIPNMPKIVYQAPSLELLYICLFFLKYLQRQFHMNLVLRDLLAKSYLFKRTSISEKHIWNRSSIKTQ